MAAWYYLTMATKTISIDLEAYEKLLLAKSSAKESFSNVIKRSEIRSIKGRAGSFLLAIANQPLADKKIFEGWDSSAEDSIPSNPWQE